IFQLPLTLFLFLAAVRRMRSDRAHPYSKPVAAAFLATIATLALGSLWGRHSQPILLIVMNVVAFAPLLLTVPVTPTAPPSPTAGECANGLRRAAKHGKRLLPPWSDAAVNVAAVLVFSGLAALSGCLAWSVEANRPAQAAGPWQAGSPPWQPILVGVLVVVYYGFAVQYFELTFRKRAQPYLRLFLFLAWGLPLLLGFLSGLAAAEPEVTYFLLGLSPLAGLSM